MPQSAERMKTMENKQFNTYFLEFGRVIEDWYERHEAHMWEKFNSADKILINSLHHGGKRP